MHRDGVARAERQCYPVLNEPLELPLSFAFAGLREWNLPWALRRSLQADAGVFGPGSFLEREPSLRGIGRGEKEV